MGSTWKVGLRTLLDRSSVSQGCKRARENRPGSSSKSKSETLRTHSRTWSSPPPGCFRRLALASAAQDYFHAHGAAQGGVACAINYVFLKKNLIIKMRPWFGDPCKSHAGICRGARPISKTMPPSGLANGPGRHKCMPCASLTL